MSKVTEQLRVAMDVMRNNMNEVNNDIGGVVGYTLERLNQSETEAVWDALRDALEESQRKEVSVG
jgi:hypothetical protein